jgi:cytochrome oxidase Cu insertion factor (SCO1/SenC/PrrC family)
MMKANLGRWSATALCIVLLVVVARLDRNFHGAPAVRADVASAAGEVGGRLPDFTLPDTNGNPVTLSHFYGKGPILLTFERSVDW